ncbi:hypothetical protein [Terasakiella pusilla]|uniref:hypothetical protein n=1 Tax=Terasakiella pusilla TaxID=64973 RepID=UPI003AA7E340
MIKRAITFSVIFISLSACQTVAVEEKPIDWTQYAQNISQQTFADKRKDWRVDLKTEIRMEQYYIPTPTVIPDGTAITTAELVNLLATHHKPLLIDVLGGKGHGTIPTAHWLKGAGTGTDFKDPLKTRLKVKLQELSKVTYKYLWSSFA